VSPEAAGDAEVGDLELAGARQEQIGRLEVAVDDPGRPMRIIERRAELCDEWRQFGDGDAALRVGRLPGRQAAAVDEFHRDGRHRPVFDKIIDAHDVRVGQLQAAAGLLLELAHGVRVVAHDLGQEFQRDVPFQLFVVGAPDDSHAAPADHGPQHVTPECPLLRRQSPHCRGIVNVTAAVCAHPPGWIVIGHCLRRGNRFAAAVQARTVPGAVAGRADSFAVHAQSEIHSLTPAATREAPINLGRDRLIPPFKRHGGVR
jgi:hypothetical protein